ncbi:unnamed protein product [Oncorhynchus mykiss]|uniref:G-protein coupled receptors family 1 profile domain-containing protein n=1 Tax=Oncorhynchus mykiss TaxID=8022 RepID=A0A060X0R7_ONCMY|nr:unnamed protein product [Oncorhynchus mykiss]
MAVLYLAVCIVGLVGNTLVIVAILKLDKMASATTVYIFNLALADGLFMVGLPFIAIQNFQNHWAFGDLACKLVMVLDGINQFTSVFCLTVMSIDRYMALVDPLRFARWRTPRRAKIVSSFLSPGQESPRLETQVTKMVVAVVLAFAVCWLPFYAFNFCSLYHTDLVLTFARCFEFVVLLSYSWSCANPILYACLSETFGRHFLTLLCPTKRFPSVQCNPDTERYDLNDTSGMGNSAVA